MKTENEIRDLLTSKLNEVQKHIQDLTWRLNSEAVADLNLITFDWRTFIRYSQPLLEKVAQRDALIEMLSDPSVDVNVLIQGFIRMLKTDAFNENFSYRVDVEDGARVAERKGQRDLVKWLECMFKSN